MGPADLETNPPFTQPPAFAIFDGFRWAQVAQSVERGPEKAGVGGSIPSLGIISCLITSDKTQQDPHL